MHISFLLQSTFHVYKTFGNGAIHSSFSKMVYSTSKYIKYSMTSLLAHTVALDHELTKIIKI